MDAGGERPANERLPRSRRITRGSEIRRIFQRGKRSRTGHLDVYDSPSPEARSRVGIVVPRHGARIVDRNRVKRRLREILRRQVLPALDRAELRTDLLVRARREAYGADYRELHEELMSWVERRCSRASSSC